jgi:hypothetical protein
MTYHHEGATGSYTLSGRDAELRSTVIREVWKRNWPLISLYAVVTLGGVGISYFTSRWSSVALSFVVALVTLPIGLRMVWRAINSA